MTTQQPGAALASALPDDHLRSGNSVEALRGAVLAKLAYAVGKVQADASDRDWFLATALAVRDRIVQGWQKSYHTTNTGGTKRVYYMSLEFLIGRLMFDALTNLGLTDTMREALSGLGVDLDVLREVEPDAALGNGGLGRLAACFMESMATLAVPAYGYGIRYENGLFRQVVKDGWQQEYPENWLSFGNPWEFARPEIAYDIGFGGHVETHQIDGAPRYEWFPSETVEAVAYDTPVVGWRGHHVNTLRLWSARAGDPLRLDAFNEGDHVGAMADRVKAEAISKVLYPSDATPAGQELRLRQEYFFAAASLQDLVRRHLKKYPDLTNLAAQAAIQLNDTHPAIAVIELMRLLVDLHGMAWDDAWRITQATFGYTNHTLLPEALETWPVPLMERMLPRHMQIIYLVNALHLDKIRAEGHSDVEVMRSVSIIAEGWGQQRVKMGTLAFIGSHRINGVSALHTDLMRQTVFRDLNAIYPDRINNKTNGITFRRWLIEANPALTAILVDVLGKEVLDDPSRLEKLADHADDPALQARLKAAKRDNKAVLGRIIAARTGVQVDSNAMFDIQIKRIHEYKRQHLNLLETIALYNAIRAEPWRDWAPRVKVFAGKAAASYHTAKLIIKLANDVARVVNDDPTVRGKLKVVFLPNYNVSLAERIIPAADLSEQISTAGMEASGTGNMKLALNGALTIGTLDGANVEIKERVGDDNIFIFGLTAEEVAARHRSGLSARDTIAGSPRLAEVMEAVSSGVFSPDDTDRYRDFANALCDHDHFLVTADFDAYYAAQRRVDALWGDEAAWWRASIMNTARVGWFSSDRTIGEYARDIWDVPVRAAE
jgi:starch phosphorylase